MREQCIIGMPGLFEFGMKLCSGAHDSGQRPLSIRQRDPVFVLAALLLLRVPRPIR
jgi:hypothetical protein